MQGAKDTSGMRGRSYLVGAMTCIGTPLTRRWDGRWMRLVPVADPEEGETIRASSQSKKLNWFDKTSNK